MTYKTVGLVNDVEANDLRTIILSIKENKHARKNPLIMRNNECVIGIWFNDEKVIKPTINANNDEEKEF